MKQLKEKYWIIGSLAAFLIFTAALQKQHEDIDITGTPTGIGDHGTVITSSPFVVWNTDSTNNPDTTDGPGNTELDTLLIYCTELSDGQGNIIWEWNISLTPYYEIQNIASGDSRAVAANVSVPSGTYANTYTGTITVRDDDGYPEDTVILLITIYPSYDLDIADNDANLVENTMMSMIGAPDDTASGRFLVSNPNNEMLNFDPDWFGNADIDTIIYSIDSLICDSHLIPIESVTFPGAPTSLNLGASLEVSIEVAIPSEQHTGAYTGTITTIGITGKDTVTDFFTLNLYVE